MGKAARLGTAIATGNPMAMMGGGDGSTGGAAPLQGGVSTDVDQSPMPQQPQGMQQPQGGIERPGCGGAGQAPCGPPKVAGEVPQDNAGDRLKSILSGMLQQQPQVTQGGSGIQQIQSLLSRTGQLQDQFPKMQDRWSQFLG